MRRIEHPGPDSEPSVEFVETRVQTVRAHIPGGQSLLAGLTALLRTYGAQSAVARLCATQMQPAVYVMPALSSSPDHAVYYSDRYESDGPIEVEQGRVTLGQRDGQTWIHCHATWRSSDGQLHCGHLLPEATVLSQAVDVELSLLWDAGFEVCADVQTNFSLFKPRPFTTPLHPVDPSDVVQGWCMRLAPNVDLCTALTQFCATHARRPLNVLGGVGSTVGAAFNDGRVVEPFVTELLVIAGQIRQEQHCWHAELDIALVDYTGGIHQGRLQCGENPVLVTCELVLVPL